MNTLIWAIILAVSGLALLAFSFLDTSKAKAIKQKGSKIDSQELAALKLKNEINSLKNELEKARADYFILQNEFKLAKQKEISLEAQLVKFNQLDNRDEIELEKLKKDNLQLKETLARKELEFEKEFSSNLNLNKELKENKEILARLEKEKREMTDKIRMLEIETVRYAQEIERQSKIIAEIKNKEVGNEWISKKEYNELKKELQIKEEELKKLQGK